MKFELLLVFLAAVASAVLATNPVSNYENSSKGVVTNWTRCGGFGTAFDLRISDCEGRCSLIPGNVYELEYGMMLASVGPSLSMTVDIIFDEIPLRWFEKVIPNSSFNPGFPYVLKFTIVLGTELEGRVLTLRTSVFHTDSRLLEICVDNEVDVEHLI